MRAPLRSFLVFALALAPAVSLAPAGCSSELSPDDPVDAAAVADASAFDAGTDASSSGDAGVPDAAPNDDASVDAGVADASVRDAGIADASVQDAGIADAGVHDAGSADAGVPDANIADAASFDGGATGPDAGSPPCTGAVATLFDSSLNAGAPSVTVVSVLTTSSEVIFGLRPNGGSVVGGKVIACPKTGCGPQNANARVITTGVVSPAFLALGGVGGATLYIGDNQGFGSGALVDRVLACPVAGCGATPTVIQGGIMSLAELVLADTKLYWHHTVGVAQQLSGYDTQAQSALPALPNAGALIGLASGSNALYASIQYTPAAIRRFVLPGGAMTTLLGDSTAGGGSHRYGLTWAAGKLYWATSLVTAPGRGLYRMNDDGTALAQVAPLGFIPSALVVDSSRGKVYVASYNAFPSVVVEVTEATGATRTLAEYSPTTATVQTHRGLAQDAHCLYFGTIAGTLLSVAK
jgi:hypothetical protein